MLNQKLLQKFKKQHDLYAKERDVLIKTSQDILRKSKQAIFALHREDRVWAEKLITEAETEFKKLEKKFAKNMALRFEGSYKAALEEYVEAKLFFNYLKNKTITEIKGVEVSMDAYLGGLSDLTGELSRKAVYLATHGHDKEVEQIKKAVEQIISSLIQLNLTGYLRTKYDQAKNNLRKIEEVLYDVTLKRRR